MIKRKQKDRSFPPSNWSKGHGKREKGPMRGMTDYNVSVHGSSLLGLELTVRVTVPRAVTVCLSACEGAQPCQLAQYKSISCCVWLPCCSLGKCPAAWCIWSHEKINAALKNGTNCNMMTLCLPLWRSICLFFIDGPQWALKFDYGVRAVAEGWCVFLTHLIQEKMLSEI